MGSRIPPSRSRDASRDGERGAWRREPLVWLAAAVFAASIAGSAWTIVIASRHADEPLPAHERRVIGVPVAHTAQTGAGDREAPAPGR